MDVDKLVAKANAPLLSTLAMEIAMTTTITVDAIGTPVTVVVQKDLISVKNANAKTATTNRKATNAFQQSKINVENQPGRETRLVTMTTTTPVAPGMEEIAAVTITTTITAKSASVETANTSIKATNVRTKSRVLVAPRTSLVMVSVTTPTTMPDVAGMKAIAVVPVARAISSNTARNASVWIASTFRRATSASSQSKGLVASLPGKETRRVMTITTMLDALGMEETVVG
jgi:hypothetical protein